MLANENRLDARIKQRRRSKRPQLENLEDRMLLFAYNGGEWVHSSRITFSFAPDGTNVGGISNNLNQAMAARGFSTATWQNQFRRAAAAWQAITNINMVEVADSGDAFSVSGNQQGDSRFGDIRIAGVTQESGLLGLAYLPPPLNGGTLAGDVVLNSSVLWNINSNYDVMTVALHEFGHSLGMDHSTIQSAAMYASYTGVKQSLAGDDQTGVRGLYSARQKDAYDAIASNDTFQTPTVITSQIDGNAQIRIPSLDIGALDHDWYYVVAPAGSTGTMTVTAQSTDLSLLSPRVYVHASSLALLGQASSTGYGGTVTVTVNGVSPGQGFYFRVNAASGASASTGNYGLLVNFGSQAIAPIAPPNTTVAGQPDQGGGSSGMKGGGDDKDKDKDNVAVGNLQGLAHAYSVDPAWLARQERQQSPRMNWNVVVPWQASPTFHAIETTTVDDKQKRNRAVDRAIAEWA